MNIQTIEVGSHWILDGDAYRYTDDQKRQLEKAWVAIDAANKDGILRGLSYYDVIKPVVRNALVMHTNLDENAMGGEWDTAHDCFATCVYLGETPSWEQVAKTIKYRVGMGLYDTKEKAIPAYVACQGVTPELLIELAEWLKEDI